MSFIFRPELISLLLASDFHEYSLPQLDWTSQNFANLSSNS